MEIEEAIRKVMEEVGYVQKEAAQGLRYTYASEAALIAALRPAMIKHGVVSYVSDVTDVQRESFVTAKGTAMTSTLLKGKVAFAHPASDTRIEVFALGEGMDAGDKSANKAMTGMLKYALRQTFLIETGDDPDKHSSEEQERAAQFVKGKANVKPVKDSATKFWNTALKDLGWSRDEAQKFLDAYKGDLDVAYKELEAQHGGPGE